MTVFLLHLSAYYDQKLLEDIIWLLSPPLGSLCERVIEIMFRAFKMTIENRPIVKKELPKKQKPVKTFILAKSTKPYNFFFH